MYVTRQINIELTGNEVDQLFDECNKVVNDSTTNALQKGCAQHIMQSLSEGNGKLEILESSGQYWIDCFKCVDYFGANQILRNLEAEFVQILNIKETV